MSDAEIEEMRVGLRLAPDMDNKTIENIVNAMKKYQNNAVTR